MIIQLTKQNLHTCMTIQRWRRIRNGNGRDEGLLYFLYSLSCVMRKPVLCICEHQRRSSAALLHTLIIVFDFRCLNRRISLFTHQNSSLYIAYVSDRRWCVLPSKNRREHVSRDITQLMCSIISKWMLSIILCNTFE